MEKSGQKTALEYEAVTILPTDDAASAEEILRDLVWCRPYVLLIVFGRGDEARAIVELASGLAKTNSESRHVLWVRSLDGLESALGELSDVPDDLTTCHALCLNISDTVVDKIETGEDSVNMFRIFKAFMRAEASEG